jgi:hypothetical protein
MSASVDTALRALDPSEFTLPADAVEKVFVAVRQVPFTCSPETSPF